MATGIVDSKSQFDSTQAASLTGVSVRQINHWDNLGIVSPSIGPARGSGSRRRFGPDDLQLLAAGNALRRAGASLESIRAAVSAIRTASFGLDTPSNLLLVLAAEKVQYLGPASDWPGVNSQIDECLTVLNLGLMGRRLREAVARETPVQVRPLRIGDAMYQVTVEPAPAGVGFRARLKGRNPLTATGPTPEGALDALRRKAETDDGSKAATLKPKRSSASPMSDGASAWGGGW